MRCNLGELELQIELAQHDIDNLRGVPGARQEIKYLQEKIQEMEGVRARAIQYGTGYYDVQVRNPNKGRTLLLLTCLFLLGLLVSGWAAVVFFGG